MAITAETFEPEHFEKLVRGLGIARQAYVNARTELEEVRTVNGELSAEVSRLSDELADLQRDAAERDALIEFVEDVGRGVRTLDELLAAVRREELSNAA